MATLSLTRGKVATIDDGDLDKVARYKWHAMSSNRGVWYARANIGPKEDRKSIYLHRFILGVSDTSVLVDHIDGDGLNNHRSNIRCCTAYQNVGRKRQSESAHNFRGVRRWRRKWVSYISHRHTRNYLGLFETAELAAEAYRFAAELLRGEFAACPHDAPQRRPDSIAPASRKVQGESAVFKVRGHVKNLPQRSLSTPHNKVAA